MSENNFKREWIDSFKKAVCSITPIAAQDFETLLPFLQYKTVKRGGYILKEGDVCKNIFFLLHGFVRMYYTDNGGNEINYRFTDQNNFFVDFQSFLTQNPSRYNWEAVQDTDLFVLPYSEVQQLYNSSSTWNHFGRLMAEHVYLQLNERVDMLLFMKPEERYLHLLTNRPGLLHQVSQAHLSSYIGIKPESLSRLRKRLSRK